MNEQEPRQDINAKPFLQIALDLPNMEQALKIAESVEEYADIFEVGSALLKKEGARSIELFKRQFPQKRIFADTKTIDLGRVEAQILFEAGADMMSVCGVASDETIEFAVKEARACGKQIVIDMINIEDSYRQVKRFTYLDPDYLAVHTGVDERVRKDDLFEQVEIISRLSPIPLAVSGGIQLDDISYLLLFHPAILMVGSAITQAFSPPEAARLFWKRIHTLSFYDGVEFADV